MPAARPQTFFVLGGVGLLALHVAISNPVAKASIYVAIGLFALAAVMEQVSVTREVYEGTRAQSNRFIVLPGHEIADTEAVAEDHGAFHVVEKTPPKARRIAERTDPRT